MKFQRVGVILFLVLCSVFHFTGSDVLAAWVPKGPTGTTVQSLFCSGNNPGYVWAGTNGGVYNTQGANYGSQWVYRGLRNRWVNSIVSTGSSCGATVLAAGDFEIFTAASGGSSWSLFASLPDTVTAMATRTSTCTGYAGTEDGVYNSNPAVDGPRLLGNSISALAVDSAGNVYAGTKENGIFITTDNGINWNPMVSTGLTSTMIEALKIDSSDNIFAGTIGGGVFMYPSGGSAWVQKVSGLPAFGGVSNFYVVLSLIKSNGILYAGVLTGAPVTGAVYRSDDDGDNWGILGDIEGAEPNSLCTADTNNLFVGTSQGVFRLDLNTPNPVTTANDQTGLISAVPFRNAFIAGGGDIFAGTDGMGIYKSSDNGETWSRAWSGTNRPPQTVNALVRDSGNMYASAGDVSGVYKSVNSGLDWSLASTGLPTEDLFGYPMYVEGTSLGVDAAENIYVGLPDGRIYKSINQAGSWTATSDTGATAGISSLTGGGIRDSTTNTLYAGTDGSGIFKTTDGGATWGNAGNGLPDNSRIVERSFFLDKANGDIYVGIEGNGLFRTVDAGNSWNKVTTALTGVATTPCSDSDVKAVTMDSSGNLYAVVCSFAIYASGDKGGAWIDISSGFPALDNVESVNVAGVYADSNNNILAATVGNGMWKYEKEYAKVAGGVALYATILEAYSAVSQADDIIQLLSLNFSGDLVLDTVALPFTLKGGYGTGFGPVIGYSTIKGSLRVVQGTVTIDNIVII